MMSWNENLRRKEINLKKAAYINARVKGDSPRQSALKAGYTEGMADNAPSKIEAFVQDDIGKLLIKAGADNAKLARRISEGLDSNKVTRTQDGAEYIDADMKERREYIKLTAELTGLLKKESTNVAIQINLPGSLASSFADEMVTIESIIDQDGTNV